MRNIFLRIIRCRTKQNYNGATEIFIGTLNQTKLKPKNLKLEKNLQDESLILTFVCWVSKNSFSMYYFSFICVYNK